MNAETGKVQQRLQFDASDISSFERRLNESVLYSCLSSFIDCVAVPVATVAVNCMPAK